MDNADGAPTARDEAPRARWRGIVQRDHDGDGCWYPVIKAHEGFDSETEAMAALTQALAVIGEAAPPAEPGPDIAMAVPGMQPQPEIGDAALPAEEELTGTVKWFNAINGYGFVEPDDGSKDVFIHASVVQSHGIALLMGGERLRFATVAGPKGRMVTAFSKLPS